MNRFAIDFSQFATLLRSSYNAQVAWDRGFRKYVSPSMYNYYCAVLLWKRILYVISARGEFSFEYDRLSRYLNFDTPLPEDICVYLNGVGNCIDFSSSHYEFTIPYHFEAIEVQGIRGTFGRVSAETAIQYETEPSLYVFIKRILADLSYTLSNGPHDWDQK